MKKTDSAKPDPEIPVRWLDKSQLSEYLGIAVDTINKYISNRRIPYIKVPSSSKVCFDIREIDDWMRKGRVQTVQEEMEEKKRALLDGEVTKANGP